ncbi:MAG: phage major capsid protein [Oscillospiraceae bacterium]|nr:phage major capsid protein [Oscillospiraceae bacterium]
MSYLKDQLKGFVPKEQSSEIIKKITRGSSVMRLSRAEPMTSETKSFPVMTSGAGAYWVGEGKRISTSGATWIFPELRAKKLAVIIPVTKEKLEDSTINVFSELQESIAEAFYTAFDAAAIFGFNSPFATSLMGAINGNNAIVKASNSNFDLAASDVMAKVEAAGYDVDGFAARIGIKNTLRKLRDANGAPIFVPGTDQNELYNQPIEFVRNGAWKDNQADLIAGEWKYSLVGIRDDIEYEILKEATLQNTLDEDGKPLSLAEQDMVAIKATMRIGYLCVKPEAFAALVPASAEIPDCTLSSLTIGSLTLSPAFSPTVDSYTVTTENNTNTITAAATDEDATVSIEANGTAVTSGSAATWNMGTNTVEVKVTNSGYSKTYTVTVTKE